MKHAPWSLVVAWLMAVPPARAFDLETNRRDALLARCAAALINLTHGADVAEAPARDELLGAFDIPRPSMASMFLGLKNAPAVGPLDGEWWRHPWRRWFRRKRLTHVPPASNDGVLRDVRVYRDRAEIEAFLDRQAEFTGALDARFNQHLRSVRTPRRTWTSAIQGAVAVAAVLALVHFDAARAWLLIPAPFVAFSGFDLLAAAAESARKKLGWPRPVDRRGRALDRSFAWVRNDLKNPGARPMHFGVSTVVGTDFADRIARTALPDLIPDDAIAREMACRTSADPGPSRIVALDFMYVPRGDDGRPALMVMTRAVPLRYRTRP